MREHLADLTDGEVTSVLRVLAGLREGWAGSSSRQRRALAAIFNANAADVAAERDRRRGDVVTLDDMVNPVTVLAVERPGQ